MSERLDPTLYSYTRSVLVLREVTEGVTREAVPKETVGSWITTFAVMFLADERIDNLASSKERKEFINDSISFLEGNSENFHAESDLLNRSMRQLREDLEALPSDRKDYFIKNLKELCTITEQIRNTEDSEEYSSLIRREGQATSRLLLSFLPEGYVGDDAGKLESVIVSLGSAGNSIDTFFDLGRDYTNGETKIRPTSKNRGILMKSAVRDVFDFVRGAGPVSALKASVLLARILAVNFTQKANNKIAERG